MKRISLSAFGVALALSIGWLATGQRVEAAAVTRVHGRIVDIEGKPLPKVKIYFEAVDIKKRVGPVRTNKKGKYFIATLDMEVTKKWRVVPQLPGYKTVKVEAEIVDSTRQELYSGELLIGSKQDYPELTFAFVGDEGRNVVDFVVAPEKEYLKAYRAEKARREGKKPEAAAPEPVAREEGRSGPAPGSREALKRAKSYTDAGRHKEAIAIYREYLVKDPTGNAAVYYYLGKSLYETGDDAGAEQAFRKGLELNDKLKGAHFYLGNLFLRQERFAEAMAELEAEKELSGESDSVFFNLGVAYAGEGREDDALKAFERAAALNPAKPEVFMQMAAIYEKRAEAAGRDSALRQEWMAKAEQMYQEVIGIDPRNAAISFYNIGVKAWNANRNQEAAQAFRKSVEIDPTYAEAHRELGTALMRLQDFEGAVEHFEEYLQLKPQAKDAQEIRNSIALLKS
ncbi:MAG: tetratricopeptide repeat protein [Acidobacteriota bacterium]